MSVRYKMDVLTAIKEKGYSSYKIRTCKICGEATLQKIRKGEPVSWEVLGKICALLDCQPGDILEYSTEETPLHI